MLVDKGVAKIKTAADLDKPEYTIVTKLGVTGEIVAKKFFQNAKILTLIQNQMLFLKY